MLVLSRREKERTIITTPSGDRIEVVILDMDRGAVRVGFIAKPEIAILRSELADRKPAYQRRPA